MRFEQFSKWMQDEAIAQRLRLTEERLESRPHCERITGWLQHNGSDREICRSPVFQEIDKGAIRTNEEGSTLGGEKIRAL